MNTITALSAASFWSGVTAGVVGRSGQTKLVEASWIVEALQSAGSAVVFQGIVINGDLKLHNAIVRRRLHFERCGFQTLEVADVSFDLPLSFKSCIFTKQARFSECTFRGELSLQHSAFGADLSLDSSEAARSIILDDVSISGDLVLSYSKFGLHFIANSLRVRGALKGDGLSVATLRLVGTVVGSLIARDASLGLLFAEGIISTGDVQLNFSNIRRNCDFERSDIRGQAQFDGATIGNNLIFKGAHVRGNVNLNNATVNAFHAPDATFGADLIARYATFTTIDITRVNCNGRFAALNSRVAGNVTFYGMRTRGPVQFEMCAIGGSINCIAGRAKNMVAIPLSAHATGSRAGVPKNYWAETLLNKGLSLSGSAVSIQVDLGGLITASELTLYSISAYDIYIYDCVASSLSLTGSMVRHNINIETSRISEITVQSIEGPNGLIIGNTVARSIDAADIRIKGLLAFSDSVMDELVLIHAHVQGRVKLFDVSVSKSLDMSNAEMDELMLAETLVRKDALRPFSFPPTVDFTETSYSSLSAEVDKFVNVLSSATPLQLQALTRVENTLRKTGRNEWADDVYMRRRHSEARYAATWFDRVRYAFLAVFSGYGVRPERYLVAYLLAAVISAVVMMAPGGLMYEKAPVKSVQLSVGERALVSGLIALREPIPGIAKTERGFLPSRNRGKSMLLSTSELVGVLRVVEIFFGSLLIATLSGVLRANRGR